MKLSAYESGQLLSKWVAEFRERSKFPCPVKSGLIRMISRGEVPIGKCLDTLEYKVMKFEAERVGLVLEDSALIGLACAISKPEEARMMAVYIRAIMADFEYNPVTHNGLSISILDMLLKDRWPNHLLYTLMWVQQKGPALGGDFDNLLDHVTAESFKYIS